MNNEESVYLEGRLDVAGTRGYSAYEVAQQNGFVGTEQEWLESLVGPAGPQGPQGEPFDELTPEQKEEIKGEDGDSAYDVAVEQGFTGTKEEWLDSLIGPQGERGYQGLPGQNGRGIVSIEKQYSEGLVDVYLVTYTDETTSTIRITNGEVTEEELFIVQDEVEKEINYYRSIFEVLPKETVTGSEIHLHDSTESLLNFKLLPNEILQDMESVTGVNSVIINNKNQFYTEDRTTSRRGITLTANNNDHVEISGTTANVYYQVTITATQIFNNDNWKYDFSYTEPLVTLDKTTSHIISLQNLQVSANTCAVTIFTNQNEYKNLSLNNDTGIREAVIDAGKDLYAISFRFSPSRLYTSSFDIMLEEGGESSSYIKNDMEKITLDLTNYEYIKIGNTAYQNTFFKNSKLEALYDENLVRDKWYFKKKVEKIDFYDGEEITTDYVSSTGSLDTGATVYYGIEEENILVTDTDLINSLEKIKYHLGKKYQTHIIQSNTDKAFVLSINALKNIQDIIE